MKLKHLFMATALAAVAALPVQAKDLRFAFQGDANSMDPYNLNETFTLGYMTNIYEGLTMRAPDLSIGPALATKWEVIEPTRWRFHLRKGVKFHDGRDFTADDVVFSADRVRADGSDLKTRIAEDTKVIKVDDHTVDFVTTSPNPIIYFEWETWSIMSKGWAEENKAVSPEKLAGDQENYATRHANGTGPFSLVSREADVKSVAKVNPNWWNAANKEHNLETVTLTPIASDATRVAALLSGQVHMAYPIPVQDMKRVDSGADTSMLVGPELRTIFLGLDQFRDEALRTSVKGKNPFKDKRVRQAVYQAINVETIKKVVMRGLSSPSGMMIAQGINGASADLNSRMSFDPAASKALLAEAGYPDGFEMEMDCPNDRYVNDEAICQAVVSMLAKVGLKVNLVAQPKAIFFKKILKPNHDTSFFLLGWTPGSFDSWNPLYNLHGCDDGSGRGKFNIAGYCNPEVDKLTDMILSETDKAKRDALIKQAWSITIGDQAYIPLHQQAVAWGVRNGVTVAQRADNQFKWRHVMMK